LAAPWRRAELARRLGFTVFAPAKRFRYAAHPLQSGCQSRFTLTAQTDASQRGKAARFLD
jgi:hypothetical protein